MAFREPSRRTTMTIPPNDPQRLRETRWFDLSDVDLNDDDAIYAGAAAVVDHLRATGFGGDAWQNATDDEENDKNPHDDEETP